MSAMRTAAHDRTVHPDGMTRPTRCRAEDLRMLGTPWHYAAFVAAGALILTGCGDKSVDTAAVETGIEDQVVVQDASASKVDCPSDVKSEKGGTFTCGI